MSMNAKELNSFFFIAVAKLMSIEGCERPVFILHVYKGLKNGGSTTADTNIATTTTTTNSSNNNNCIIIIITTIFITMIIIIVIIFFTNLISVIRWWQRQQVCRMQYPNLLSENMKFNVTFYPWNTMCWEDQVCACILQCMIRKHRRDEDRKKFHFIVITWQ